MPLSIKDLKITSSDFEPLGRLRDEQLISRAAIDNNNNTIATAVEWRLN